MGNELYHHGIKGQKWGVRRYQNKDGSLTLAGKKRALSMQNQYTEFSKNKRYHDKDGNLTYAGRKKDLKMKEKYSELTGKQLRKFSEKKNNSESGSSNRTKSIKEMSNDEIQSKIDRIRLENTLNSLTPKNVSTGHKFVNSVKESAIYIAKDKGTKIVGDYIDKQLRDKLGLSKKDTKTAAQILQEEAQKYENRQKIDKGQRYFKEGKYAEQTYTGDVEGEGTSSRSNSSGRSRSNRRRNVYDDVVVDAEWREVNDDDISYGRTFIAGLLEDKTNRR